MQKLFDVLERWFWGPWEGKRDGTAPKFGSGDHWRGVWKDLKGAFSYPAQYLPPFMDEVKWKELVDDVRKLQLPQDSARVKGTFVHRGEKIRVKKRLENPAGPG